MSSPCVAKVIFLQGMESNPCPFFFSSVLHHWTISSFVSFIGGGVGVPRRAVSNFGRRRGLPVLPSASQQGYPEQGAILYTHTFYSFNILLYLLISFTHSISNVLHFFMYI